MKLHFKKLEYKKIIFYPIERIPGSKNNTKYTLFHLRLIPLLMNGKVDYVSLLAETNFYTWNLWVIGLFTQPQQQK